ncbi:MAG: alanine racemase [Gammaproteobacteria bacterium]|nr:alanine racemase [Gammaproteobacteria bacterium]
MSAASSTSIPRLTRAVIDLSACRHNLSVAKQSVPGTQCIAIIKANAYGHGMVSIAKALSEADAFGVARINEAIQLREADITKPILLLEGFTSENELDLVRKYNLDCVIHNELQLQLLEKESDDAITICLKVDSGMHRLGFNPDNVEDVYQRLEKCSSVNHPVKLMTHLANADDKHDEKTLKQIDIFYKSIEGCLSDKNTHDISIANSAGILGWPQSHSAWNRPGIMLYGVSPFINSKAEEHNLKPVMTMSSQLIAVKKINKGEAIGYGGTYVCEKDMTVGIVAIGYGDGYPRHAKTGTPVLVNNKRCALLGRVSMDMICVDLSQQDNVQVNDPVILWGKGLAVEEIAEAADTIAYELLCGVTNRVEFSYID